MPAYESTTPDNIAKLTNEGGATLVGESQTQGDSIQLALNKRQRYDFVWANAAARTAQTGMVEGSRGYQIDIKSEYLYESSNWRLATPHVEFTCSATTASGIQTSIGTMTVDTARSTSQTFAVSTANGRVTVVDPGVYAISGFSILTGGGTTALVFMQMSDNNTPDFDTTRITRGGLIPGDDTMTLGMPNHRTTVANQNLYFIIYQFTGVDRTFTTRIRITRVG